MTEPPAPPLRRVLFGDLSWTRLLKSIAFIYGALLLFAVFGSDALIFLPHPSSYGHDPTLLTLTAAPSTRIAARYLETPGARYTVLFSHGNAEDIGDDAPLFALLREAGVSVLAYDYEGYGLSDGKPSERRVYADVDAAYAYLTQERHIAPSRIIAYGRSLGGGPAVDLASREPIAGLVLESTFMSTFRVATRIPLVPFDKFENLAKMPRVKCPVLVFHGRRDRLISLAHGEALFDAATGPKRALWVDEAGHADLPFTAGPAYGRALREFLEVVRALP